MCESWRVVRVLLAKRPFVLLVNFDGQLAEKITNQCPKARSLLGNDMTQTTQPSLLLVDTNAEAAFAMASDLSVFGYRVLVANSVDQAIVIGQRETFELLLCCEPLDVADAPALLRFLRRNRRLRQLRPVIKRPCQAVGVCLKVIHEEPVYCLGRTVSVEAIHGIVKQTLAMEAPRPRPYPLQIKTPHLKFGQRDGLGRGVPGVVSPLSNGE